VELRVKVPTAIGEYPRRDAFGSDEAFMEARKRYAAVDREFWSSPEGHEATRARRSYWAFCAEDGGFILRDLPVGAYELQIELRPPPASHIAPAGALMEPPAIAAVVQQLSIASEDATVDLGIVELKSKGARP
jgi:hypothetical protein